MDYKSLINTSEVPSHVAIIMDGNGRWAKKHNKPRIFGHKNGVLSVRSVVEGAGEIGLKYLTLYAFSTENWKRPKIEIAALMQLLVVTISNEVTALNKNGVRLLTIGDLKSLPGNCERELRKAMDKTKNNKGLTLVLALSYSSKSEIINAVKKIATEVSENKLSIEGINDQMFNNYLDTSDIDDPELLIRTSGECRLSNFLLWQIAYSELYFTDKFWPDFTKDDLFKAVVSYQKRERRFGMTSEQLSS
ncbi:MAG: isoprenyl transferase [Flavobacteriales bacterium]|nr:isoprenyl transferase [Flavobacteriales bacterium]NQX96588.1 isoprenyl transferase [Flavobacteriales bacterium]